MKKPAAPICEKHPTSRVKAPCDGCKMLVCSMCRTRIELAMFCPSCLAGARATVAAGKPDRTTVGYGGFGVGAGVVAGAAVFAGVLTLLPGLDRWILPKAFLGALAGNIVGLTVRLASGRRRDRTLAIVAGIGGAGAIVVGRLILLGLFVQASLAAEGARRPLFGEVLSHIPANLGYLFQFFDLATVFLAVVMAVRQTAPGRALGGRVGSALAPERGLVGLIRDFMGVR